MAQPKISIRIVVLLLMLMVGLVAYLLAKMYGKGRESSDVDPPIPKYFFYNEITWEVQWTNPGGVPYEDEFGQRWWLTSEAQAMGAAPNDIDSRIYMTTEDPYLYKYTWVEQYSEDAKRSYFYNQKTEESTWERPADLAWRRVKSD